MKYLIPIFSSILVASLTFTSCKSDEKLDKIGYKNFKIDNNDIKLVDGGSSEIRIVNNEIHITAEFEVIKTYNGILNQEIDFQNYISLVPYDKDGHTIELLTTNGNFFTGKMGIHDIDDGTQFANFLRSSPGSKTTFTFNGWFQKEGKPDIDIEKTKAAARSIKSFKVLTAK